MKFSLKRIASTALAGALALSLAVPAFATSTQIDGSYTPINVKVTVSTTGKAIINPYGMPMTLGEATIAGEQITTSAPMTLMNKTSVALSVGAEVSVESTKIQYDATLTKDNTVTDKKVKLALEVFGDNTLSGDVDKEALNPLFAGLKSDDAPLVINLATTGATAPVIAKGSGGGDDEVVLAEAKDGEMQKGGLAFFRLTGFVAKKAEWAAEDTFTAKIAWTFTPTVVATVLDKATFSGKVASDDSASAAGTLTITLTGLPEAVTISNLELKSSDETVAKFAEKSGGGFTAATSSDAAVLKVSTIYVSGTDAKVNLTVKFLGSDGTTYKVVLKDISVNPS